ncbi:hypothetical protein J6590_065788 [Homalodisca vitripennis]|nr:hypothetical protein J6590_065788 [Homalodisca vitripennis]
MSWILIIIFFLVVMCFGKFICGRLFREWTQNISEKPKNVAIQGAREVDPLQNTMSDEGSLPAYKRKICREPTPVSDPFKNTYVLSKAEKNAIKTFENCKKVWASHNLDVPEGLIREFEHFHKVWKIPKLTPRETVRPTKEEEPISVHSQVSMQDEHFKEYNILSAILGNENELKDDKFQNVCEESQLNVDQRYSDYDKEELACERAQVCKHDGQFNELHNKLSHINILMAGPSNENDFKNEKLLNVCEEPQLKVEQTFSGDKVEEEKFISKNRHVYTHNRNVKECYYQVCYNDVILPTANRTVGNREDLVVLLPPVSENASQFEENNSELSDDSTEHVMLDIIDEEDEENNEVFERLWPKVYNEAVRFERPYKQLSIETMVRLLPDLDTVSLSSSSIDSTCG